jgi:hypothetical protein
LLVCLVSESTQAAVRNVFCERELSDQRFESRKWLFNLFYFSRDTLFFASARQQMFPICLMSHLQISDLKIINTKYEPITFQCEHQHAILSKKKIYQLRHICFVPALEEAKTSAASLLLPNIYCGIGGCTQTLINTKIMNGVINHYFTCVVFTSASARMRLFCCFLWRLAAIFGVSLIACYVTFHSRELDCCETSTIHNHFLFPYTIFKVIEKRKGSLHNMLVKD